VADSSFFDEIAKNRLRSIALMLVFGALFAGIIYLLVIILGLGPIGFGVGLVLIVIYALFVYFSGDSIILRLSKAKEADRKQYSTLYEIVEGLTVANQIPMPKVYVVDDPNPNAFSTGRNNKHSAIVVNTGLLVIMNRNELEGVIAHELSHIADNDIQFMMIAVVFAGVIGLVAAYIRMLFFFGVGVQSRERERSGLILLIAFVVGLIAPLIALLIRLAISRKREYMADANGARITRDPASLASALKKIQNYTSSPRAQPVRNANEVTSSLYFSNPLSAKSLTNLFSTHPPIEDRIYKLQHMY
jgi:heat shock protein HtpX